MLRHYKLKVKQEMSDFPSSASSISSLEDGTLCTPIPPSATTMVSNTPSSVVIIGLPDHMQAQHVTSLLPSSSSEIVELKRKLEAQPALAQALKKPKLVTAPSTVSLGSQDLVPTIGHNSNDSRKTNDRPSFPIQNRNYDNSTNNCVPNSPVTSQNKKICVLALPEDHLHLNPLHCFVRNNIEVFTATPIELAAPSPGRKVPIKLGQVGLRCIHCRFSGGRSKRSVCYPSSVTRVYHSVSDMKFDHFSACKHLPPAIREEFNTLKELFKVRNGSSNNISNSHQRSHHRTNSSKTAQYYLDSALKFGMRDTDEGIFIIPQSSKTESNNLHIINSSPVHLNPPISLISSFPAPVWTQPFLTNTSQDAFPSFNASLPTGAGRTRNKNQFKTNLDTVRFSPTNASSLYCQQVSHNSSSGFTKPVIRSQEQKQTLLATKHDELYLNPMHCFVRRNVEVFAATRQDMAAPSMGRKKSIVYGQVGIRCIHCVKLPYKDRVKRAVCYPPTISGIYHSVSNMKFDHFGACRGLSPQLRSEFLALKQASLDRKDNKNNNKQLKHVHKQQNRLFPSNTSQFYAKTARDMGLIDTEIGIQISTTQQPQPTITTLRNIPMSLASYQHNSPSATSNKTKHYGMSLLMMAAEDSQVHIHSNHQSESTGNAISA